MPNRKPHRIVYDNCLPPSMHHLGWSMTRLAEYSPLKAHKHECAFEICYIAQGAVRWWAEDRIFPTQAGDLYLTWPGEIHGGVNDVIDPCELFWCQFSLGGKASDLGLSKAEHQDLQDQFNQIANRVCPGNKRIAGYFKRLLDEHKAPTKHSKAIAKASLQLLIYDVLKAYQQAPATGARQPLSPRVQRSLVWLRKNLSQSNAITHAAQQMGLRPSYFREEFGSEMGMSPKEYLMRLRVREAERRLAQSEVSITELAFILGFSSSQHFATCFRKYTGQTPSAYRKLMDKYSKEAF